MYIFSLDYRNSLKRKLADYIYNTVKSDTYTGEQVSFIIKSTHLHMIFYCMLLILFAGYRYALSSYIFAWAVFLLFIYLNGCFLTLVEYKLDNQNVTIVDPVIMLFGDKTTKKNRMYYSIISVCVYLFIATIVMSRRFDWLK